MKIYIWGTGKCAEKYLNRMNENVEVLGFIDGNRRKESFFDRPVLGFDSVVRENFDYIVICSYAYEEIIKQIVDSKIPFDKVFVAVTRYYYKIDSFLKIKYTSFFSLTGAIEFGKQIIEEYLENAYLFYLENREKAFEMLCQKNGRMMNIKEPLYLNEKIRRMEIDKFSKLETLCSDKYAVRNYVNYCGLQEILVPIYAIWNSVEEIKFDSLPEKCVLKCTHSCGTNIIYRGVIDVEWAKDFLKRGMADNFAMHFLEWHYSDIVPRIICEKLLEDGTRKNLLDYKYFCCNGEPQCILLCSEREMNGESKHKYYDLEWKELQYATDDIRSDKEFEKPVCLERMNEIVKILAAPFPFVRVDLYVVEGKIYFGELTFTPMGGFIGVQTDAAQKEMGELIDMDYELETRKKIYECIKEV